MTTLNFILLYTQTFHCLCVSLVKSVRWMNISAQWRRYLWVVAGGCTFSGLTAATGGDPGGLCMGSSEVKLWLAICMHSSRVFRKVVHVDFNMFPVSSPAWERFTRPTVTNCRGSGEMSHGRDFPLLLEPGPNSWVTSADSLGSSLSLILLTCWRRRSQYSRSSDILVFRASVLSCSSEGGGRTKWDQEEGAGPLKLLEIWNSAHIRYWDSAVNAMKCCIWQNPTEIHLSLSWFCCL